jgi:outer membrane immunogenic protein
VISTPLPAGAPAVLPVATTNPLPLGTPPAAAALSNPATPAMGSVAVTMGSSDIADQPPPPPSSPDFSVPWTGVYVGGNLGGGWTRGGSGESCTNLQTGMMSGCDITGGGSLSTGGVLGGAQIGYLRPINVNLGPGIPLMLGIEADIQGSGISGSQNETESPIQFFGTPETCSLCNFTASQSIDWFGTLRAKVGVPVNDKVLIYATGGLIFGGVTASQDLAFLGTSAGFVVNKKATLSGPTVGGGVEFHLDGPWSVKIEGLYYDLGDLKTVALPVNGAPSNFGDSKTFGFHGGMIRVGINYRLGDPGGEF